MKILVCFKFIRDEEGISVNADRTINLDSASWVISPYDLNAIEAGMKLASAAGESSVEVLTVGGEALDNSKMRKAVLSRGPVKMYGVKAGECGDMYSTAVLLKRAVEKIGDVDLVICGEGSGDMYSQAMGTVLAALLNTAAVNSVEALSFEDGAVFASRSCGKRVEKLRLNGPSVVSVTSDICRAHIPSMKDIMAAGKKPVEVWDASEFESVAAPVKTVSVLAPERTERMQTAFKASDENGIDEFVKALKKSI